MGNYLAQQWVSKGYYYDMVSGFPTEVGGYPRMIAYPEWLLELPKKCPKCNKSSGLQFIEMHDAILAERRKFMFHAEAIVTQRRAKGEADPYFGFGSCKKSARKDEDEKEKQPPKTSSALLSCLKRNGAVAPEKDTMEPKEETEATDDSMGFEVDINKLVFCSCNPRKSERYQGMGWVGDDGMEVSKDKLDDMEKKSGRRDRAVELKEKKVEN